MMRLGCGLLLVDAFAPVVTTSAIFHTPWIDGGADDFDCALSAELVSARATGMSVVLLMTFLPFDVIRPDSNFAAESYCGTIKKAASDRVSFAVSPPVRA